MKQSWGWGIGIFLLLFMGSMIGFMVFAWHQDVNLVHENYYEKGVDYSSQLEKETRSALFSDLISAEDMEDSVRIRFPGLLAHQIDSGRVLFYRPSDHNRDLNFTMNFKDTLLYFTKESMIPGRYIVKMTWFLGAVDFEVDKILILKENSSLRRH